MESQMTPVEVKGECRVAARDNIQHGSTNNHGMIFRIEMLQQLQVVEA